MKNKMYQRLATKQYLFSLMDINMILRDKLSYFGVALPNNVLATLLSIQFAALILTSCTDSSNSWHFNRSSEAIKRYQDFLFSLRKENQFTPQTLITSILQWRELSDSVFSCICRETNSELHNFPLVTYERVHDSIRTEYYRLVSSKQYTYRDVVSLKQCLSVYSTDAIIKKVMAEATPFFHSLDGQPIYKGNKETTMTTYREFLAKTLDKGIHNQQQLLAYIMAEDRFFRSFLSHLYEMSDISVSDITRKTETICSQIFQSVEKNELSPKDVMVYMAIRTNRRLILNAQTCINDIYSQKIKHNEQFSAYLWMIIQPFCAIDDFGFSVLTEKQKNILDQITINAPEAIARIDNALHTCEYSDLPRFLIELYIATF